MQALNLKVVDAPRKKGVRKVNYAELGYVGQFKATLLKQNRLALVWAFLMSAGIPIGTFIAGHFGGEAVIEVTGVPGLTRVLLVAAGLLFSAPKVWKAFRAAFGSAVEATGGVVLMEAMMTLVNVDGRFAWLAYAMLALLVTINVAYSACKLASQGKGE